jgi:hypothetical protein
MQLFKKLYNWIQTYGLTIFILVFCFVIIYIGLRIVW